MNEDERIYPEDILLYLIDEVVNSPCIDNWVNWLSPPPMVFNSPKINSADSWI